MQPTIDLNANVWKEVGYNLHSVAAKQEAYRLQAQSKPSMLSRLWSALQQERPYGG